MILSPFKYLKVASIQMEICQQLVLPTVSLFSLLEDLVHRFAAPDLLFLPGQGSHPFRQVAELLEN